MSKLLKEQAQLDAQEQRLQQLRDRYRGGEKSLSDQILDAEAAVEYSRQQLSEWRNKVIRLETR